MVYDTSTREALHPLTDAGHEEYRKMLEREADEILFSSLHPFKYWGRRIRNLIKNGDSTWDGPNHTEEEKYKDGFEYSC